MKIGYLYYDLLNLYGDNGNIKILVSSLEKLGIKVDLKLLTVNNIIDFDSLDMVYMGFGTEGNQKIAFNDLKKYKADIKKFIDDNKFFLVTGNSIELFGKGYLELFDYETKYLERRFCNEALVKFYDFEPMIGLYNQIGITKGANLFKVLRGLNEEFEGFKYNNFYATYLIGPILARNPHFLEYLLKEITKKDVNLNLEFEYKAYRNFMENIDKDRKL